MQLDCHVRSPGENSCVTTKLGRIWKELNRYNSASFAYLGCRGSLLTGGVENAAGAWFS